MRKNIFGSIVVLAACGFLCAAGQVRAQEASGAPPRGQKVLVVYYSRDGHTQMVAEQLAKKFHADIERLRDLKKRTGLVGAASAGKDAIAGNTTALGPLTLKPQEYEIILLGTPSWFSNPSPAVRTFVAQNQISNKKIGLFGTAHMTGVADCLQKLAGLISKERGANFPRLPLVHRDLEVGVLSKKIDAFYAQVMAEQ